MCVSDAVNASNISTGFQIYEKRDESDDYELHGQFTNIRLFKFHPFKFFKLQNVTAFFQPFCFRRRHMVDRGGKPLDISAASIGSSRSLKVSSPITYTFVNTWL